MTRASCPSPIPDNATRHIHKAGAGSPCASTTPRPEPRGLGVSPAHPSPPVLGLSLPLAWWPSSSGPLSSSQLGPGPTVPLIPSISSVPTRASLEGFPAESEPEFSVWVQGPPGWPHGPSVKVSGPLPGPGRSCRLQLRGRPAPAQHAGVFPQVEDPWSPKRQDAPGSQTQGHVCSEPHLGFRLPRRSQGPPVHTPGTTPVSAQAQHRRCWKFTESNFTWTVFPMPVGARGVVLSLDSSPPAATPTLWPMVPHHLGLLCFQSCLRSVGGWDGPPPGQLREQAQGSWAHLLWPCPAQGPVPATFHHRAPATPSPSPAASGFGFRFHPGNQCSCSALEVEPEEGRSRSKLFFVCVLLSKAGVRLSAAVREVQ